MPISWYAGCAATPTSWTSGFALPVRTGDWSEWATPVRDARDVRSGAASRIGHVRARSPSSTPRNASGRKAVILVPTVQQSVWPYRNGPNSNATAENSVSSDNNRFAPRDDRSSGVFPVTSELSQGFIAHVRLDGVDVPDAADPIALAMASILARLPDRSLSATMLVHLLRGSEGPTTVELASRYGFSQYGAFATTPFRELRSSVLKVAGSNDAFEVWQRRFEEGSSSP